MNIELSKKDINKIINDLMAINDLMIACSQFANTMDFDNADDMAAWTRRDAIIQDLKQQARKAR